MYRYIDYIVLNDDHKSIKVVGNYKQYQILLAEEGSEFVMVDNDCTTILIRNNEIVNDEHIFGYFDVVKTIFRVFK